MHPIKKKRLRRQDRNLLPTCPQFYGRRVSNWTFFLIPPSLSFLLLLVTALPSLQPLPKAPQNHGEPGSKAACLQSLLLACTHSPVSVLPVRQEQVRFHSTFAFAHGAFFSKIQRKVGLSGEQGEANSTSYFQTSAPQITRAVVSALPGK